MGFRATLQIEKKSQNNGLAVFIFICGSEQWLEFLALNNNNWTLVKSFYIFDMLHFLYRSKSGLLMEKLKLHSGLTRICSSILYLQTFSQEIYFSNPLKRVSWGYLLWRRRPKNPLFWCRSRLKRRRAFVKSFHIKVSWFSSADFGPKTPLLFFFFSIYDTKQKEFHIRTMLLCESLLHQDQLVSKAYAYQGFFLLTPILGWRILCFGQLHLNGQTPIYLWFSLSRRNKYFTTIRTGHWGF